MLTANQYFRSRLVIVGGGVPQMAGFPWNALEQRVRNGLRSELIKDRFQIIPSQAETYGGCLGGAAFTVLIKENEVIQVKTTQS